MSGCVENVVFGALVRRQKTGIGVGQEATRRLVLAVVIYLWGQSAAETLRTSALYDTILETEKQTMQSA